MTYLPNIPSVTESPAQSAPEIQVNFEQFDQIFSTLAAGIFYNHMALNDNQGGKHGAVIFQRQTLDPGVTGDLDVLYSKNSTSSSSTEPQLFVQIPKFLPTDLDTTNAPNAPMQLTFNSVNTSGPVYYSFLPGGYIIYFGMVTGANSSPTPIVLAPTPSVIIACFAMPSTLEPTPIHNPIKISVVNTSPTGFNVFADFTGLLSYDFNWMAIAVA